MRTLRFTTTVVRASQEKEVIHHNNGSATGEWLLLSAELEHCESGVCLERRNGRWILDGVLQLDSFASALDLLRAEAA